MHVLKAICFVDVMELVSPAGRWRSHVSFKRPDKNGCKNANSGAV